MLADEWKSFLRPLSERPALAAFFCTVLFVSAFEFPVYALAFVPILLFSLLGLERFSRRVSLGFLLFFAARLLLMPIPPSELKSQELPANGTGFVESLIERPEGVAAIVSGEFGKIRFSRKVAPFPAPGDSILFSATWFPTEAPTVPGAFDSPKWLRSQGLSGFGRLDSFQVLRHRWVPEQAFYAIRKGLKAYFAKYLPPAETGLLTGLLAGDRSSIPDSLQNGFRRAGVVHVLAISGFHIVLLSGMLLLLLRATKISSNIARTVAILLMLLYAPVTGGSPAVYRAVFMFAVVQAGTLFERKADSLNSLGFALLLLTIAEPKILWNVGFELSAAATAGIIAYGKRSPFKIRQGRLAKNPVWKFFEDSVLNAVWITLVATAATAPFLVWSFRSLSPVSILGNVLVVPLVSLGMHAGIFALLLPIPAVASIFCAAAGFLFRISAYLVSKISSVVIASVTVGPFPAWILILSGICLLSIGSVKRNFCSRWIFAACCLTFGSSFFLSQLDRKLSPNWKVSVVDVGQGDCILVESPGGRAFLVDAGVNSGKRNVARDRIIPFLQESGIWKLEALVITHPDLDHFSGAALLLQEFPIKSLWIQECARFVEKPEWKAVLDAAMEKDIPVRDIRRGMLFRETSRLFRGEEISWEIRAVHPDPFLCGETNSESITLRIEGPGGSILLTGDLTKEGEYEILQTDIPLKTDILKLGHHGSKTSSSPEFLKAVNPQVAIASNGRRNRYRHPHKQVVERLDSLKIPLLNTSQKGTVEIDFSESGYRIQTAIE